MKNICVFASSSKTLSNIYKQAATHIGELIAKEGLGIVFGAGTDGLMGELARGAHSCGGYVVGVIPDSLNLPGIVYEECDELYDTRTMRQRKAIMEEKSFAFIALPGGFGTLEEILEIITLKQLGYHQKPIVVLNTNGFYSSLISQFEETVAQSFATPGVLDLFRVCTSPQEALEYIRTYNPAVTYKKNAELE